MQLTKVHQRVVSRRKQRGFIFPWGGGRGGIDVGDIANSIRCRSSNSARLSRTNIAVVSQKKITFSIWVKRGTLGTNQCVFCGGSVGGGYVGDYFRFNASNQLEFIYDDSVNSIGPYATSAVFRDPTAWTHIVIAFDTTQAVQADRCKVWINNAQTTISNGLALNADLYMFRSGSSGVARFGCRDSTVDQFYDGEFSRIAVVDGEALTPSSFGYLNTDNNAWTTKSQAAIKAVVDAGGTNSFMLDFDNGTSLTTLGYDKSSKGNNWTLNNFSLTPGVTYDWMTDTPSNNFATLNPLTKPTNATHANGNLYTENTNATTHSTNKTTIHFQIQNSDGWTWEVVVGSSNNAIHAGMGLCPVGADPNGSYTAAGNVYINGGGGVYLAGSLLGTYLGYAVNDVVKVWASAGNVYYSVNGVAANSGNPVVTGLTGDYVPCDYRASSSAVTCAWSYNLGQRPFAYTPPAGFKALCTANLPDGETITTSGSFTGNASADGPYIDLKGVPTRRQDRLWLQGSH